MNNGQKLNLITKGLTVAVIALAASNVVLFNKLNAVESNMVSTSDVAALKDNMIALEKSSDKSTRQVVQNEQLKEFLLDNPQAIVKSLAKYRFEQEQLAKKQKNKKLQTLTEELYQDKLDPYMGNPKGKHVIVEFMDYNCGYCKRLGPVLEEFIRIDPEAKVIIKEYPIFQNKPTSAYAALMGTAVFYYNPELYPQFHNAIVDQKRPTKQDIDSVVASLGVTKAELEVFLPKAQAHIEKVRSLGAQLQVSGTPTIFRQGSSEPSHGGWTAQQLADSFKQG